MQADKAREKGMEMDEERKHRDGLRKRGEAEDSAFSLLYRKKQEWLISKSQGEKHLARIKNPGYWETFQSVQSTT